jgi:Bacterial regulatory proteins, luxR family
MRAKIALTAHDGAPPNPNVTVSSVTKRLYVSETTVTTQVAHVLDKLGLRDRVQAVIVAYEVGLGASVG